MGGVESLQNSHDVTNASGCSGIFLDHSEPLAVWSPQWARMVMNLPTGMGNGMHAKRNETKGDGFKQVELEKA